MDNNQIDQAARDFIEQSEYGDADLVAQQLATMRPDDRRAVAEAVRCYERQNPSADLPKLEFYDDGMLESASDYDPQATTTTRFDQNGVKVSHLVEHAGGPKESHIFDSQTGREVSRGTFRPDGSSVVDAFDHNDGSFRLEDVNHADGSKERYQDEDGDGQMTIIKYDPQGRVVETESEDHKTRRYQYDEAGQLCAMEGYFGRWTRQMDGNGRPYWHNQERNFSWQGDFSVDREGTLFFDSHRGQDWKFMLDGKNVRI